MPPEKNATLLSFFLLFYIYIFSFELSEDQGLDRCRHIILRFKYMYVLFVFLQTLYTYHIDINQTVLAASCIKQSASIILPLIIFRT